MVKRPGQPRLAFFPHLACQPPNGPETQPFAYTVKYLGTVFVEWHSFVCACGTIDAMPQAISLEAAIAITQLSKRTLWRRVSDGAIRKISDAGARTLLALEDIEPLIVARLPPEELEILLKADAGDAEAQDDIGQMFLAAGKPAAALYWLEQSAGQDYPNAMQRLSRCYFAGDGVPKDEYLAIMWLAKAAAHGHAIAQAQMHALFNTAAPCVP